MGKQPSRDDAAAAADRLSKDAIKAAVRGDADRARELREQAALAQRLLRGQHD